MRIVIGLLLALTLVGCSTEIKQADSKSKPEKNMEKDEVIKSLDFKSPDDKVAFSIMNLKEANREEVEQTKDKVLEIYKLLDEDLEGFSLWSEVYITLSDEWENNRAEPTSLKLKEPLEGTGTDMMLVAESLIKYNRHNKGAAFFHYGHRMYLEEKYGNSELEPKTLKAMQVMIDNDIYIPVKTLLDPYENERKMKEGRDLVYAEAFSFTSYLIDTYGVERFSAIFNVENFDEAVVETYGKDIETLEKEWLKSLQSGDFVLIGRNQNL